MKQYLFILLLIITEITLAQTPKLILPLGHTSTISAIDFSTDGKKILTIAADGKVIIWDANTYEILVYANFTISSASFEGSFNADATKILVYGTYYPAKSISILDAFTGRLLYTLDGHKEEITYAVFSPDGKRIISGSQDNTIRIWDADNGKLIKILEGHTKGISCIKFDNTGKKMASSSWDSTVRVWDESGNFLFRIKDNNSFYKVEFDPAGKKLLTDNVVKRDSCSVWDADDGKLLFKIQGTTPQFSHDGKKILTTVKGSVDWNIVVKGSIKIWDIDNGKLLENIIIDKNFPDYAFYSPDDKSILIIINNNTIKVLNLVSKKFTTDDDISFTWPLMPRFSLDGKKIVACQTYTRLSIWDPFNARRIGELKGHTADINTALFNPDANRFLTVAADKGRIWDIASGKLVAVLEGEISMHGWRVTKFSPDGKALLSHLFDEDETDNKQYEAKLWNTEDGRLLKDLNKDLEEIEVYAFSPDGKKIAAGNHTNEVKIWSTADGNVLTTLPSVEKEGETRALSFSPDNKKLLTASANSNVARLWNTSNGELLTVLHGHTNKIMSAVFSPDGNKILTASWDITARVWNAVNGELLLTLRGHKGLLTQATFDLTGKKILSVSWDSTGKIWDADNGKLLTNIKDTAPLFAGIISPDENFIITAGNKQNKVWDAATGNFVSILDRMIDHSNFSDDGKFIIKENSYFKTHILDARNFKPIRTLEPGTMDLSWKKNAVLVVENAATKRSDLDKNSNGVSFMAVDSGDYIVRDPSSYYLSTPPASKLLHYVTKDLKVISFEQLDVRYNRPDKVLEALGNSDTALINSYRNSYFKRIKKLGIDTTGFVSGYSVPEADIVNRNAIAYEQKKEKLNIHIKGGDSLYKLDRFNLWINEVPVFGMKGVSIKKKNSNQFDTTLTVLLSAGENRIEVSISNSNGIESYRMPLVINFTPTTPVVPRVYFAGIGINQFADRSHNLQWCTQDIRDLLNAMKKKYGERFEVIDTLFDQQVSLQSVKKLKKKLLKTGINDKVIISYSGHGLLSKDFDYYLSSYTTNFSNPEDGGIPYDEFENLLDSIPARKKILFIDACNSGEVDKEELKRINNAGAALAENKVTITAGNKGGDVEIGGAENAKLGIQNSFELMQTLFVNVGKGTGATIISASGGVQFAQERSELGHGVFTYSLIEAIQRFKTMKISALKKFVGDRVTELTNGLQKPTTRNELIDSDWDVW